MTLIQTFFTTDRVIQVSDRRLTRAGKIFDDDYTKLVCWDHTFTVGFTGLARIDVAQSKSTALWIAEVLSDYRGFENGVSALRQEAETRIRQLPKTWPDRRLAIVVAGFDQRDTPLVAQVRNFNTETGAATDQDTFIAEQRIPLEGRSTGSHTAGAAVSPPYKTVLRRHIPRILQQQDGLNRSVRTMLQIQRYIAEKNPTVGEDSLCVTILRNNPFVGGMMSNLGGPDIPTNTSSFGFFDKKGWQFEQRAPLAAGNGFVTEYQASADPDYPDNQRIGMRHLKVPPSWGQK